MYTSNKIKIGEEYKETFLGLHNCWAVLGKTKTVLCSPYIHISIFISIMIFWFSDLCNQQILDVIFTKTYQICPSLLGFTIAGLAVFMGGGDKHFSYLIAGDDACYALNKSEDSITPSPYISVVANFTSFAIVYSLTILNALLGELFLIKSKIYVFFSLLLFIYAIITIIEIVQLLYLTAETYNDYVSRMRTSYQNNTPETKVYSVNIRNENNEDMHLNIRLEEKKD